MPGPKLNEQEKKERKRYLERMRKARIKNDPVLRDEHLRRDRERLAKRRAAGLILKRNEMTSYERRIVQYKNRISARAYYYRKKAKANIAKNSQTSASVNDVTESLTEYHDIKPDISQETKRRHSARLLQRNDRANSLNIRIEAIVSDSSQCLQTNDPLDISIASSPRRPSTSSIKSEKSSLRSDSPNLEPSLATNEFNQDDELNFSEYKRLTSLQINDLTKQLVEANKEKLMYKNKYMKLCQEFKKFIQSNLNELNSDDS